MEENEDLKLQLFWRDYGVKQLKHAMGLANQKVDRGPDCWCLACDKSGRRDARDTRLSSGEPCLFKPYLEALLAECGLVHAPCDFKSIVGHHECDMEGNPVYDLDTHIMTMGGHENWIAFSYGARLWRARSIHDPELNRLRLLFVKLLEGIDDD
jgi:hypothetical protein